MHTDHEANSINDKSRVLSFHVTVSEPTDANRTFYTRSEVFSFASSDPISGNLPQQNNGFASLPYKQRKQKDSEELTLKRNRR